MSRRGEWADHVIVIAMAEFLKAEIVIVTSSPNELDDNIICISTRESTHDVFLLGHIIENHYQSLTPCEMEIPGKISNFIFTCCFAQDYELQTRSEYITTETTSLRYNKWFTFFLFLIGLYGHVFFSH